MFIVSMRMQKISVISINISTALKKKHNMLAIFICREESSYFVHFIKYCENNLTCILKLLVVFWIQTKKYTILHCSCVCVCLYLRACKEQLYPSTTDEYVSSTYLDHCAIFNALPLAPLEKQLEFPTVKRAFLAYIGFLENLDRFLRHIAYRNHSRLECARERRK